MPNKDNIYILMAFLNYEGPWIHGVFDTLDNAFNAFHECDHFVPEFKFIIKEYEKNALSRGLSVYDYDPRIKQWILRETY